MYITDFEYANQRLSDFGFMVGHVDSNSGTTRIDLGCDVTFKTVKNNHTFKNNVASSTYENVYEMEFDIIKKDCLSNKKEVYITPLESEMLIRWLNKRGYHRFKPVDKDGENLDVVYYGSFNVKEIAIAGRLVGLSLSFKSNAPYGFSDIVKLQYILTQKNETFSIFGENDEETVIYPKIEIRCLEDGDLKILNQASGNYTYIANCRKDENITIDGEYEIIFTNNNEHEESLPNDFNYEYFEILMDDYNCENIYEVTLPCEVSVVYEPIRKVGVY